MKPGRSLPRAPGSPVLLGALHLQPLPGAPRAAASLDDVEAAALRDADTMMRGGLDGIIVENFGDAPFERGRVEPWTVAAMTRIALRLRARVDGWLGVNVLRNDARAALAIAASVGAELVRVNVFVGAAVTDQGVIEGCARSLLQARRALGATVAVAADLDVKHAAPLVRRPLADEAADAWHRGGADALIVTGPATGRSADLEALREVRRAVPEAPIWLGSGLRPDTAGGIAPLVDGVIVGTFLHTDADLAQPVDPERTRALVRALRP